MKRTRSEHEITWEKEQKRITATQQRRLKKAADTNPFYHGKNISTQPGIFDAPVVPAMTPAQEAARILGSIGGKAKSRAKTLAARANAKRPRPRDKK